MKNKPVNVLLVLTFLRFLQAWRRARRVSYSEVVARMVPSLTVSDVLSAPEHPYGSGKVSKVFRLPEGVLPRIRDLANESGRSQSTVIEAAFLKFLQLEQNSVGTLAGPNVFLEHFDDETLRREMQRRGFQVAR